MIETEPTPAGSRPAGASAAPAGWRVSRSSRSSRTASGGFLLVVAALFLAPALLSANAVEQLTSLLIFLILAVMWNALAGYGGLVSVGQQAFIGVGAYATIYLTQHGMAPYPAIVVAALVCAALAAVESLLVLRLRGGQFAVGTWVVAEALAILVILDKGLGGGTGISLRGLNVYTPDQRRADTFWLTLGFAVLLLGLVFGLLRWRTGAALQAIRDDEEAAAALGVRVRPLKFVLFVLAGFGCGAAGALTLATTLFVQPQSIFGVQFTGLHDLHGAGRRPRNVRGPDHRRRRVLPDSVRVRRPGRLLPDRSRSRGRAVRAVPAARAVEPGRGSAARAAAARGLPAGPDRGSARDQVVRCGPCSPGLSCRDRHAGRDHPARSARRCWHST